MWVAVCSSAASQRALSAAAIEPTLSRRPADAGSGLGATAAVSDVVCRT